jgi:hypothetical protein
MLTALSSSVQFVTLGNHTNNRIECQFGKIKSVVDAKRRFSVCVQLLLNIVMSADVQGQHRDYVSTAKTHFRNGYSGPYKDFFSICTPYAVKKILEQAPDLARYKIDAVNDEVSVVNVMTGVMYRVQNDCTKCSCSFCCSMLLPCRHILAA